MNKAMKAISAIALIIMLCLPMVVEDAIAQNKSEKPEPLPTPLKIKDKRDDMVKRLEAAIPRLMSEGDVPGLSIAVIRDAKLSWQRAFGVMNAETKQPVTDSTVFEAASLTKPVFAYAVLKLAESGKMDLDTPLSKYLPEPYIKGDDRINLITARMVLSHRTGFPNWRNGPDLKIHFMPGERFSYSGEGFVYLQKTVERITGQPTNEFMTRMVFEPLGMTSSSFLWRDSYSTLKAAGHNMVAKMTGIRKISEANTAGGLHTTTSDYAKFVIAAMNGTGLKKQTVEEMLRPQIKVDMGCSNCVSGIPTGQLSPYISWGLGWGLQQTNDGLSFWHWGDNNGDVNCYVVAYPRQKLGLAIFTNSGNGHSIIPEIISEAIGGKHPAIAWINYEPYNSPARKFYRDVLARGEMAVTEHKEPRKNSSAAALTEGQVNRTGYWLIEKKRMKEAIAVFKMNVEDFPNSWNVYDSLGEAYMINGDKELAIKFYEKSLELNPNNKDGAEMLKKLRGQ